MPNEIVWTSTSWEHDDCIADGECDVCLCGDY